MLIVTDNLPSTPGLDFDAPWPPAGDGGSGRDLKAELQAIFEPDSAESGGAKAGGKDCQSAASDGTASPPPPGDPEISDPEIIVADESAGDSDQTGD